MATILIVDDETAIRESLEYALQRDGFDTISAGTLADASPAIERAELILLDLMLPDGNGLDFLKEVRATSRVPVIVLTSRDGETDRVVGLELGADDYVVKPFSPRELVARVRAVLRRTESPPPETEPSETIRGPGGIELDPVSRRARAGATPLDFSRTEFDLVSSLLRAPGRVFTRDQLLEQVWGPDCVVSDRTVDAHVKTVRRKLAEAGVRPEVIETVRGVGYRANERTDDET